MRRGPRDLTAKQVAALVAPGRYRVAANLYLQIQAGADGKLGRSWIFRYRIDGRERAMGIGPVELVALAAAREQVLKHRVRLLERVDPLALRHASRGKAQVPTFVQCVDRYIAAHASGWRSAKHTRQWRASLEACAFPVLGKLPVNAIDVGRVLEVLEPIWTEKPETASRVRGRIEVVLDWAKARGYRDGANPALWRGHLDQLLPQKSKIRTIRPQPAMAYAEVPEFLAWLRGRSGARARALEFLVLTAARTGEVLGARWGEIDLGTATWTIPAGRTKRAREHRVPLSPAALALLQSLPRVTDQVFPGGREAPALSPSSLLALMREKVKTGPVPHGFRSSFSDWAAEQTTYPSAVVEAALAHANKDKTAAAYRRTDHFEQRRPLMADWAAHCLPPAG